MKIGSRGGVAPSATYTRAQAQQLDFGPGIGSALTGLGLQVNQYAEWKTAREKQEAENNANLDWTRTSGELSRTVIDQQRNAPENGAGFTDQTFSSVQQAREAFFQRNSTFTPEQRQDWEVRWEGLQQEATTQAFTFEADRATQYFVRTTTDRLSEAQTRLYENPDLFEAELESLQTTIRNSTLTAPEQEALLDQVDAGLASSVIQKEMEQAVVSATPAAPTDGSTAVAPGLIGPQVGLLNTIAADESDGRYDVLNGGETIEDLSDHPRRRGAGGTTTAAGRYQIVAGTWDEAVTQMRAQGVRIDDFSPVSQDRVAMHIANRTWKEYAVSRGLPPDLATVLTKPEMVPHVRSALGDRGGTGIQWAALVEMSDEEFGQHLYGGTRTSVANASAPTVVEPEGFDWAQHVADGGTREDAISGMEAPFRGGLAALITAAPENIRSGLQVFSGFRSTERQQELWDEAVAKYGSEEAADDWVARPGNSQHEHGNAADLRFNGVRLGEPGTEEAVAWLHANADQYGLNFRLDNEPWHIEGTGQSASSPSTETIPPPAPNEGQAHTMPDILNDPRFARVPFERRMELQVASQNAMAQQLASQAQKSRDLEAEMANTLALAFANNDPGSLEAIQTALSNGVFTDVRHVDSLRGRIADRELQMASSELASSHVNEGRTLAGTSDDEKLMMGLYEERGITQGIAEGDPAAIAQLVHATNQTSYIPPPMLATLNAQLGHPDAQRAAFAAEAITAVYAANPTAFAAFATEDQLKTAVALSTIMDTSTTPEQAVERMRYMTNPATAQERKNLTELADEALGDEILDGRITNLLDSWAPGENLPEMPVSTNAAMRLTDQYKSLYREGFVRFRGDEAQARTYADTIIKNRWSPDPVSGALMEFSPAAPGARIEAFGPDTSWIAGAVRFQVLAQDDAIPADANIALLSDGTTRQQFAANQPPTYQAMVIDENGDIRLMPERIVMEPTALQRENRDRELRIHREEVEIERLNRLEISRTVPLLLGGMIGTGGAAGAPGLSEAERRQREQAQRRLETLRTPAAPPVELPVETWNAM